MECSFEAEISETIEFFKLNYGKADWERDGNSSQKRSHGIENFVQHQLLHIN